MNKLHSFGSIAMSLVLIFSTSSCSNSVIDNGLVTESPSTEMEVLTNDLRNLNTNYTSADTRMPKWLRWLIFSTVDVAAFVIGELPTAISASSLAWTVTQPNTPQTPNNPTNNSNSGYTVKEISPFSNNAFNQPVIGVAGNQHNEIIKKAALANSNLFKKEPAYIVNTVLDETSKQMGVTYSAEERQYTYNLVSQMINYFDANKSINEYISDLKTLTTDQTKIDALDACGVVLEGLQYVDYSDSTYITKAMEIVKTSKVKPQLKEVIINGISIADGSSKLWNTDSLIVYTNGK